MTKPAIKVEGLWKEYVVGAAQQSHATFYDLLSHSLKAPFNRLRNLGGSVDEANHFWALKDVISKCSRVKYWELSDATVPVKVPC